ncbi:MAG: amino acid adenylation domain-containing protein, partial [Acidobacteriota bacterium]
RSGGGLASVPGPQRGEGTADGDALSFAQQRMWFLAQWNPTSPVYNVPTALRLRGPLDLDALGRSLNATAERHRVLRTRFQNLAGEPTAVVDDTLDLAPELEDDLLQRPEEERLAAATARVRDEARTPFDLTTQAPVRTRLVKLADDDHILVVTFHHIASDGESLGVFGRELSALYSAETGGLDTGGAALPELPIQYADYAAWQQTWLSGGELERQVDYWRGVLGDIGEPLPLPTDLPRPALPRHRGEDIHRHLPESLGVALDDLCRGESVTLFMVLLAAWGSLLGRLANVSSVPVGCPVAGRTRAETEGLVGFFVNTLVMRADFGDDPTFRQLLARIRGTALDAWAHQDVPFEKLVEALQPERTTSHHPFFQAAFQVLDAGDPPALGDADVEHLDLDFGLAKLDVMLGVARRGHRLQVTLEYDVDLFERNTAERWLGAFETLVGAAVADPDLRISELPVMSPEERRLLTSVWNGSTHPYPRDRDIADLFGEIAHTHPDRPAVTDGDVTLTYSELLATADTWAAALLERGVGPETPVALLMERGVDLVTAIVAIIRAGGIYVPLDRSYPEDRLIYMLQDTAAPLVLAQEALLPVLPWLETDGAPDVLCVDRDRALLEAGASPGGPAVSAVPRPPSQGAYVIYTSGSTGKPKGVVVPHLGVVRLARDPGPFDFGPEDRVAHCSNVSFDVTTLEIWGALLNGACLVAVERDVVLSPQRLAATIRDEGLTMMVLSTAVFHQLAEYEPEAIGQLRGMLFGGDRCEPPRVRAALDAGAGRVVNCYGPTEATTMCVAYPVTELAEDAVSVPIGTPLSNDTAYVVDRRGHLAAPGTAGELWVGGDGLARGYHRKPAITAAAFVPNPFADSPGERLYRTGDLVRHRTDGNLDFLGRIDHQVKLRGFRIELEEIEGALRSHEDVASALVLLRGGAQDGGPERLVAYIEARGGAQPEAEALRSHVGRDLPDFMVPSAVVTMDAFPLTPNGKVDRKALPLPEATVDAEHRPPSTPLERLIADAWGAILSRETVGLDDDFFALGGHSLLATKVFARLQDLLELELPLHLLFDAPCLGDFSAQVEARVLATPGGEDILELLAEMEALSEDEGAALLEGEGP